MGSRSSDESRTTRDPAVGVVTVVYRSDDVLPAFLDSVPAASHEPLALIVVDNAPTTGSRTEQLTTTAGGRYIALPSNPGYGGGMNAGARALPDSVQWVLISNPDVVLEPEVVDTLLRSVDGDDTIGAVGPAVVNADGSLYPSARAVPSLRTGVGHALFVRIWHDNPWTRRYMNRAHTDTEPRDAGWLSGSCVLVRRDVFDELGGFDEQYFMYFEDVDLGYRIGKAGYRNRYEPAARVMHSGAHSTTQESAKMVRAHHDSARRFLSRKYPGWWLWPVRAVLSAGLSVRSAVLTRRAQ